jgi:hypothetical protein
MRCDSFQIRKAGSPHRIKCTIPANIKRFVRSAPSLCANLTAPASFVINYHEFHLRVCGRVFQRPTRNPQLFQQSSGPAGVNNCFIYFSARSA